MRAYTQRPDHNTGNYVPYSLQTVSGFFNVLQSYYKQVLWDGAYGLSSLSEKTRKSNHLQMQPFINNLFMTFTRRSKRMNLSFYRKLLIPINYLDVRYTLIICEDT